MVEHGEVVQGVVPQRKTFQANWSLAIRMRVLAGIEREADRR